MILAWTGAALIGLSLGLLGSGGSILTVPVLVYLVGEDSKLAITESLAIVGCISLFAAIPYARSRQVDWRTVLLFGLPGMLGTYGASVLSQFLPGSAQLLLFAVVMLLAATFMFRPAPAKASEVPRRQPLVHTLLQGLGVGVLTGLVGVGGGFLIVPALALLVGLPMPYAVGSSLVIITLNSFTGFARHLHPPQSSTETLHWPLIGTFALIGILGSLVGSHLNRRLSNEKLRRGFAVFLVLMGVYVLSTQLPQLLHAPAARAALAR